MRALDVRPKTKPELLNPTVRARLKHLGRQVAHTTVDSIFSGQLASLGKRPGDDASGTRGLGGSVYPLKWDSRAVAESSGRVD